MVAAKVKGGTAGTIYQTLPRVVCAAVLRESAIHVNYSHRVNNSRAPQGCSRYNLQVASRNALRRIARGVRRTSVSTNSRFCVAPQRSANGWDLAPKSFAIPGNSCLQPLVQGEARMPTKFVSRLCRAQQLIADF